MAGKKFIGGTYKDTFTARPTVTGIDDCEYYIRSDAARFSFWKRHINTLWRNDNYNASKHHAQTGSKYFINAHKNDSQLDK